MAITGTISKAKQNDFLEIYADEDELKEIVENADAGDHITIHAGNYPLTNFGNQIDVPSDVYITILPGASVPVDKSADPTSTADSETEFPTFDIFKGHTENVADLNLIGYQEFYDRVEWTVQHVPSLDLKEVAFEELSVPHSNPFLTVNKNSDGKVKLNTLGTDEVLVSTDSDGTIESFSDFTFDGSKLTVTGDVDITGTLDVDTQVNAASLKVEDIDSNRIVTTNSGGELRDVDHFRFDGSTAQFGTGITPLNIYMWDTVGIRTDSPQSTLHVEANAGEGVILNGGGTLSINSTTLNENRGIYIDQSTIDDAIYIDATSTGNALRIQESSSDVLTIDGNGNISSQNITVSNEIQTPAGENLILNPATSQTTVQGDLVVNNDLTVSGTTTTIDTTNINVSDSFLLLNSDYTGGSPTENAGIEVERGTLDNVDIRWNESGDVWEFTNDGTNYMSFASVSTYTAGDGLVLSGNEFAHEDTSSASSTTNTNDTVVQNISVDQFGHITSISSTAVAGGGTNVASVTDDQTISSGATYVFDLTVQFGSGTTTNDTVIQVFVQDDVSGSPTENEYISAEAAITLVRKTSSYEIINETGSSHDFRIVAHKF